MGGPGIPTLIKSLDMVTFGLDIEISSVDMLTLGVSVLLMRTWLVWFGHEYLCFTHGYFGPGSL